MRSTVKLEKQSMEVQPIFIVCVTLYNMSSIFNLNVRSFSKKEVF